MANKNVCITVPPLSKEAAPLPAATTISAIGGSSAVFAIRRRGKP